MASASKPAIELQSVSKQFGVAPAVTELSLTVARGQILGFLGPNGAGKTTTINMLMGFVRPTSGQVFLLGHNMSQRGPAVRARARVGYVPDVAGLHAAVSGAQLLHELEVLQGQPAIDRERTIDALELRRTDLQRPMGQLSRGTRQKINLIQGLQHRPELLILDEPGEGLDPLTKRGLFDLLLEARDRGATVFFSSHILSEVEALCDRVALIRRGRLLAVDDIAALRTHMQRRVSVMLEEVPAAEAEHRLRSIPTVSGLQRHADRWQFQVTELRALLTALSELPVQDVTIEAPSLEDIFLHYYRKEGSGE